ncbi:hypothetical protein F5Y05DRAFT_95292 [Hypoxylon sp. FL0543]|nr:hypothetical protein F5Y05DRAFT_95292 [Hypoxylon sp. FL0543]
MLAKQQYVYAALVGFGSLAQAAVQFPTCVTSCVRQNGCAPTSTDCMCEKASGSFLSDVTVCMNQWCSADTKFTDLLGPIQSNCKVPQKAIDAAVSKAGFDTSGVSSGSDSGSSYQTDSAGPVISATMGVGAPNKVDGSTSAPEATGTATKGGSAGSLSSGALSGTAVVTAAPTASQSLLVATTLSSVPSATSGPASSSTASSSSNTSDESGGSSDGSPAGSHTGGENAATTSQASLLAAVMAVAAAMAFGW